MTVEPSSNGVRFGDWMGQLPASWSAVQIKNLGLVTLGKMVQPASSDPEDVLSPYLRAANVQPDGVLAMSDIKSMWFSPSERATLDLRRGDAVVVEGGIGGYGRAAYVQENLPGVGFQNSINRIRPLDNCDGRFITYCLIAARQRGFIAAYCNIVSMPHFTAEKLASMKVPAPPYERQQQIADFLDRETARIDTLIEKQQRLIATLRERRKAVATHLVVSAATAGDGSWKKAPVKRFFTSLDGRRIPLSAEERGEHSGPYPYYGASGVIDSVDDYLFDEDVVLVSEDGANLLARSTPIAFPATGKIWVNNHAHVLRPMRPFVDFWAARIEALDVTPFVTGSAQPKLTAEALMSLPISAPSSDEEVRRITDDLAEQTAKIDVLIKKAQRFIELSKERRSALITAAVTGQIDVRETEPRMSGTEGAA